MQYQDITRSALAVATLAGAAVTASADGPAVSKPAENKPIEKKPIDKAFDALGTFDWGKDRKPLQPIDDAVVAAHGDAAASKALEIRLVAVLKTGVSRAAKDFICRTLLLIGTAECVPALAVMLPDADLSHMARYALEHIPAPEAVQALRDTVPNLSGRLKIGVIGSLGVRRDAASVAALAISLDDADAAVACAAAFALGDIGTPEAANILRDASKAATPSVKLAVADARLVSAERLLADGKKTEALTVYKSLIGDDQSKQVRLAATRGMLLAAGKKD